MNFSVWAPIPTTVKVNIEGHVVPMTADGAGWWTVDVDVDAEQVTYGFVLDDDPTTLPDPRSRFQPEGVHGLSQTYDPTQFVWTDAEWAGRSLAGGVIYELHLGTFTPTGTLDAAIERLPHLVELGIDFVELLPVNAFNGTRNWGYDGVLWYCVDDRYGGPAAYQRFVDACHRHGLAVVQDVVYNHLGPSGNYLPSFGPYLRDDDDTAWGASINLDDAEVRRYIIDNAAMWFGDYHVDALRLDAVHALVDTSQKHILQELAETTAKLSADLGRPLTLIAESDLNDPTVITPTGDGGYGIDAQWSDDFHHAVHVALTGELTGYYADFEHLDALAEVLTRGFYDDGTYSSFRGRRARPPDRHRPHPDVASRRRQPEPRPDRQPGNRRPIVGDPRPGTTGHRRRPHADKPLHADAVHGRGMGSFDAVAVLHRPPGARPGQGNRRGTHPRIRGHSLRPVRGPGPPSNDIIPRLQTRLVRDRHRQPWRAPRPLPQPDPAPPRTSRPHRPRLPESLRGVRRQATMDRSPARRRNRGCRQPLDRRKKAAVSRRLRDLHQPSVDDRRPSRPRAAQRRHHRLQHRSDNVTARIMGWRAL